MGPWRAALQEIGQLPPDRLAVIQRVKVDLYGSLAKTGHGHGTDMAVQLGLSGKHPENVDVATIQPQIQAIKQHGRIKLTSTHEIPFCPENDIVFHNDVQLPFHPNGLRITIIFDDGSIKESVYYSVGGGFIVAHPQSHRNCLARMCLNECRILLRRSNTSRVISEQFWTGSAVLHWPSTKKTRPSVGSSPLRRRARRG